LQGARFWLRRDPAAWRKFRINQMALSEVFAGARQNRQPMGVTLLDTPKTR